MMIRLCKHSDFESVWAVINDGASVYKGIIPEDCWNVPYMTREKLANEMADGVVFWQYEEAGTLLGVMGIQQVQEVTLIRHAYVGSGYQNRGIGTELLAHLRELATSPVLIGTWADAVWAIRFYEKHGFRLVSAVKDSLLKRYWNVSERQIQTSVVLADPGWFETVSSAASSLIVG